MCKKLKFAGCTLAALIVLPILVFFGYPLVVAFAGYVFPAPIHQGVDQIESIQILDTNLWQEEVLYTLEDDEIRPLMDELLKMKTAQYVNDPPDGYGTFAIRITYCDGYSDTIGTLICSYRSPTGENASRGWYYVDREKLMDLIDDYIDPAVFS